MNRRTFSSRAILTTAGIAVLGGLTATQTACTVKDVGFYVDTITGALKALQPLLPGAAGLISKAITIANDLASAYKAGKFATVASLFANLSDLLNQIASDAGVNSPQIKVILALAGVALMTIAAILKNQTPAAAVSVAATTAKPDQIRGARMIEHASSAPVVDQVFGILKVIQQ